MGALVNIVEPDSPLADPTCLTLVVNDYYIV